MHIIQDILIVLLAGYMTIDQNGPVVMSWFSVIVGTISGLIMGDLNTGLMIGGTFQLMWRSFCPKLRTCNNYRYIYRSPHRNGN